MDLLHQGGGFVASFYEQYFVGEEIGDRSSEGHAKKQKLN